jgi:hypothetical protein
VYSTIRDNTAAAGGGVLMIDPAHGIISGTTIVGNHAETAGANSD